VGDGVALVPLHAVPMSVSPMRHAQTSEGVTDCLDGCFMAV